VDWPIVASNAFMTVAIVALIAAPIVGVSGGWAALRLSIKLFLAGLFLASFALLAFSWRGIAGGVVAAALGHLALVVSILALAEVGRLARTLFADRLAAAMAGLFTSAIVVIGIFAMAPLTENISAAQSQWLLFANPLVAVTSAAGIDLLHLDTIYRTSPLAHRGVVVPAWTTACAVYAVVGLAAYGASRIRPWSHQS
jgi:hypothetical protein